MKASVILKRAVSALSVQPATLEQAKTACANEGIKDPSTALRLYKEWVNDVIVFVGSRIFERAKQSPDTTFLTWLTSRLGNPFHVSHRAHDKVRALYGDETALLFAEVRWAQEVAYAHRMRGHDNDRIVFLAEMWLQAAKRDASSIFHRLVECYVDGVALESAYSKSPNHLLDVDEIRSGEFDETMWRPLWLRFSEREFSSLVNNVPRNRLTALVSQIREKEFRERVERRRLLSVAKLRSCRFPMMIGILSKASELGLSSDDVLLAERKFIENVENGAIDLENFDIPGWRVFLKWLQERDWQGQAPPPGEKDAERRLDFITSLKPSWTDGLPDDYLKLGASNQSTLLAWFDEVVSGKVLPPEDPALDYGLWLIGNLRAR